MENITPYIPSGNLITLGKNESLHLDSSIRIISGFLVLKSLADNAEFDGICVLGSGDVLHRSMFLDYDSLWIKALGTTEIQWMSEAIQVSAEEKLKVLTKIADLAIAIGKNRRIKDKIMSLIIFSHQAFGNPKYPELPFAISQQDIAEILKSTRVTITRLLGALEEDKKIKVNKRRISLINV